MWKINDQVQGVTRQVYGPVTYSHPTSLSYPPYSKSPKPILYPPLVPPQNTLL